MTDLLASPPVPIRPLGAAPVEGCVPEFSVVTLVTDHACYLRMLRSFAAGGLAPPRAEFLYVDNRVGNHLDAYAGLRALIGESRARTVVAVHQDVLLLQDGADRLAAVVADLDAAHKNWAVAGNAGIARGLRPASRITDPHETDARRGGPFPARVISLDENLLVIRRESGVLPRRISAASIFTASICACRRAWPGWLPMSSTSTSGTSAAALSIAASSIAYRRSRPSTRPCFRSRCCARPAPPCCWDQASCGPPFPCSVACLRQCFGDGTGGPTERGGRPRRRRREMHPGLAII